MPECYSCKASIKGEAQSVAGWPGRDFCGECVGRYERGSRLFYPEDVAGSVGVFLDVNGGTKALEGRRWA